MPLKGIKVIELAGLAPVPFCGMILADFGASVIRIDRISNDLAASIDFLGNGKRSIGLNIKEKDGVEILKKITDQSDVLIEPYRPGVMESLGLGPDVLMQRNKKLIYARLTGFGQSGPYANMAGHDINYVAISGLLSLFGRSNEKPIPPVNLAADFGGGGLICALGIALALFERTRSNTGQVIDASMVEGAAYLGSWLFRSQGVPGVWGQPRGKNLLDTGPHFYDTYETKDGRYMAVGSLEPQFYQILTERLGLSESDVSQFDDWEESKIKFAKLFKEKTQDEWCTVFDGTDACVTPILSLETAPDNPHNKSRNSFSKSKDTDEDSETIIPQPAPKLSRTPGFTRDLKKPRLSSGEHTFDILLEFGYKPDEIQGFIKRGVVHQSDLTNKL